MRFYMLDRIIEWKPGESARGIKNVSMSEDYFVDHFPRYPVMPGVLIIEAMAQLSGLLLQATVARDYNKRIKALLTMLQKVKFRNISKPGDTLLLDTKILSIHEDSGRVQAMASTNEKNIADAEMTFVWYPLNDPELELKEKQLLDFLLEDIK